MTPAQFIEKWSPVTLAERAASQERFIDLDSGKHVHDPVLSIESWPRENIEMSLDICPRIS